MNGDVSSLLQHSYSGEPLPVSQTARRYIASRQPRPEKNHIALNRRALQEKQNRLNEDRNKRQAELDEKRRAVGSNLSALEHIRPNFT